MKDKELIQQLPGFGFSFAAAAFALRVAPSEGWLAEP
jgi:hypothetical protein